MRRKRRHASPFAVDNPGPAGLGSLSLGLDGKTRMRVFHYMSGEEVVVGDYVREIGCRDGRVVQIIQPDSEDAVIFDCPEGGMVTAMDMSGTLGRAVWEPPDGDFWEDLEFIRRGSA